MGLSRQEVNLRRLLAKCELMCKSNNKEDERFDKYLASLDEMLGEVKKTADADSISRYQSRITSLKTALGLMCIPTETEEQKQRKDLLGLRHRTSGKPSSDGDMTELISYHEDMQKKITDDMLTFTKSLKEQSQLANKIIRKDTEVVSQSTQLTDQNHAKLTVESAKLAEHSKRAWKCWLWVMLAIVLIVFINMVMFMKVMKKSK